MQSVKQHDNLRRFPNAASINTGIRLDKILGVPVITLKLTAESDRIRAYCLRRRNT